MQRGPRASPGFRAGKEEEELDLGSAGTKSGEPSGKGGDGESSSRRESGLAQRRRKGGKGEDVGRGSWDGRKRC